MADKHRDLLNKAVSSEIKRQETKAEEQQLILFVSRLCDVEKRFFQDIIDSLTKEHETILAVIQKKAEEIRLLHLGLPLKMKYLEMEEVNMENEVRRRWQAILANLPKPNPKEESA